MAFTQKSCLTVNSTRLNSLRPYLSRLCMKSTWECPLSAHWGNMPSGCPLKGDGSDNMEFLRILKSFLSHRQTYLTKSLRKLLKRYLMVKQTSVWRQRNVSSALSDCKFRFPTDTSRTYVFHAEHGRQASESSRMRVQQIHLRRNWALRGFISCHISKQHLPVH